MRRRPIHVEDVIRRFVAAINDRDVDAIVALCTDDHQFVDAYGGVVSRETLRSAWAGYFAFMPHYGIEIETILVESDQVAVFGWAWGGLEASDPAARAWRRPCAWRACVSDERVRLWQVYVDTKIIFDML